MRRPKVTIVELLVLAAIASLIVSIVLPVWRRYVQSTASTTPCIRHQNRIGLALLLYAEAHGGRLPDSFAALLRAGEVTPETFLCEDDDATAARDVAGFHDGPAHCSFLYLGDGLPMPYRDVPADALIVVDRPDNHGGDGVNCLFGDGHTEFKTFEAGDTPPARAWRDVQAQIARGDRPVLWRDPSSPATTRATR